MKWIEKKRGLLSRMGARVQVVSQVVGDKGPSLTDGPAASTQERKKNGLPSFEKYALLGKGWASSIFGAPLWKQSREIITEDVQCT